jgi:hypothetical protein
VIDPELDMPDDIVDGDSLFLGANGKPLPLSQLENQIESFLLHECHCPDWQVSGLIREPAVEMNVGGIQMARYGNLIAAKYNKAEAVEYFVKEQVAKGYPCKRVVFVDDNIDNVFGVFSYFANREVADPVNVATTVRSVWYEPPQDGHGEKFDPRQSALAQSIMRPIDAWLPPKRVHGYCVFEGFGMIKLKQKLNGLGPVYARAHFNADVWSAASKFVFAVCNEAGGAWNPSGYPLDPIERPGCLGFEFDCSGSIVANNAVTMYGRLSVMGKNVVLLCNGDIVSRAILMERAKHE